VIEVENRATAFFFKEFEHKILVTIIEPGKHGFYNTVRFHSSTGTNP